MNVLLLIVILAAMSCIGYSIILYSKKEKYIEEEECFHLNENEGRLTLNYKDAIFNGYCTYGVSGEILDRHYSVQNIYLSLISSTSTLHKWTTNELYEIERELNTRYPEAEIIWEYPMRELLPNFEIDQSPK